MYMNINILYYLVVILLILTFSLLKKISKKNKMRIKMMTHGILNKIVLVLMIAVLMYEDLLLGLLALLIFFEMTNIKYEKESLLEYFSCGKKH